MFECIHVLEDLEVSQDHGEDWKTSLPVPVWENSLTFLVDKIKLCSVLLVSAFLSAQQL